jgi:hypothetical protein
MVKLLAILDEPAPTNVIDGTEVRVNVELEVDDGDEDEDDEELPPLLPLDEFPPPAPPLLVAV